MKSMLNIKQIDNVHIVKDSKIVGQVQVNQTKLSNSQSQAKSRADYLDSVKSGVIQQQDHAMHLVKQVMQNKVNKPMGF